MSTVGPLNTMLREIADHDKKTIDMVGGLKVISLVNFRRRREERKDLVKSFLKGCKK